MSDIKLCVAKRITELRTAAGMTQLELAQKLNYSDKSVSKWERGESLPEISVLVAIAEIFEVSLDYIVGREVAVKQPFEKPSQNEKVRFNNRTIITLMIVLLVFFAALFAYVVIDIFPWEIKTHWVAFIYAIPVIMIVWLVFNSIWFNKKRNYLIISLLVWSVLLSVFLTMLLLNVNMWQVFLLGIPGQLIIFLWSKLKF